MFFSQNYSRNKFTGKFSNIELKIQKWNLSWGWTVSFYLCRASFFLTKHGKFQEPALKHFAGLWCKFLYFTQTWKYFHFDIDSTTCFPSNWFTTTDEVIIVFQLARSRLFWFAVFKVMIEAALHFIDGRIDIGQAAWKKVSKYSRLWLAAKIAIHLPNNSMKV